MKPEFEEPVRITAILDDVRAGAPGARERLLDAVYQELKRLAAGQMRRGPRSHTLQPTAVVHEAYLRMLGADAPWNDRAHFFATASKVMRGILVDHARARSAIKRGGDRARVTWREEAHRDWSPGPDEIIAVHDALEKLETVDERMARVVELRFFAGLTVEEAAAVLGLGERTVYGLWESARVWLRREIAS